MTLRGRFGSAPRQTPIRLALVVAAVCLTTVPRAFAQG